MFASLKKELEEDVDRKYIYCANGKVKFKKDSRAWLHKSSDRTQRALASSTQLAMGKNTDGQPPISTVATNVTSDFDLETFLRCTDGAFADNGMIMEPQFFWSDDENSSGSESSSVEGINTLVSNSHTDMLDLNGNDKGDPKPVPFGGEESQLQAASIERALCSQTNPGYNGLHNAKENHDLGVVHSTNTLDLTQDAPSKESQGSCSTGALEYPSGIQTRQRSMFERRQYVPMFGHKGRRLRTKHQPEIRTFKSSSAPLSALNQTDGMNAIEKESCNVVSKTKKRVGFANSVSEVITVDTRHDLYSSAETAEECSTYHGYEPSGRNDVRSPHSNREASGENI